MSRLELKMCDLIMLLHEQTGETPAVSEDGFIQWTRAPRPDVRKALKQLRQKKLLFPVVLFGETLYTWDEKVTTESIETVTVWRMSDK